MYIGKQKLGGGIKFVLFTSKEATLSCSHSLASSFSITSAEFSAFSKGIDAILPFASLRSESILYSQKADVTSITTEQDSAVYFSAALCKAQKGRESEGGCGSNVCLGEAAFLGYYCAERISCGPVLNSNFEEQDL